MNDERVLCVSEEPDLGLALVRLARSIVGVEAGRVFAVVLPGSAPDVIERIAAGGADGIHVLEGAASSDPHVVAEALSALVSDLAPTLILMGSTKRGRELAGRLAGTLDLPATTGVTGLRLEADGIRIDREALSGNAVAVERIVRRPAIVAVMSGVDAPPASPSASTERSSHPMPTGRRRARKLGANWRSRRPSGSSRSGGAFRRRRTSRSSKPSRRRSGRRSDALVRSQPKPAG
ncbi:MAG: hypothetical protein LVQ64_03745 [Thermoplasmatales archaeon]|nr:hypothetical protein [Thermoplasmatales archaeon]